MQDFKQLTTLVRRYVIESTTMAGSGHPTSCLSAVDLMTVLMFGGYFRADLKNPEYVNNDRLIFSKGHAAPLLYSLYTVAGAIDKKELLTLRTFGSRLEGHPTMKFPYTEVPTGSLGQGLSVGVGMAMNAKSLDKLPYNTFVLLGDSEFAEGQNWEALQIASYYKLNNLIGILDVNRLGQRGETMLGYDIVTYKKRIASFGWDVITIDGHNIKAIHNAYKKAIHSKHKPFMIIAKTTKGKGIKFLENKNGWHGKALQTDEAKKALNILKIKDENLVGKIKKPTKVKNKKYIVKSLIYNIYKEGDYIATRKAYGNILKHLGEIRNDIVVLDAETSNSTYVQTFAEKYPKHFFEMFIAEQNMISIAMGLSARGKKPFISTFAAFFSRAHDQIRMAQYAQTNICFVGSHVGVSIGEDGASQMGLEDIAMFRSFLGSVVLYPSDAVSTERLVVCMADYHGLSYIRTTRMDTPVIYSEKTNFKIGGSQTIKKSKHDVVTVLTAGVTVHEALQAYEMLKQKGIIIRVVDLYSIKPLDLTVIKKACADTKALIVVEDHYKEGGIYEAVCGSGVVTKPTYSLCVQKQPMSGRPEELLSYEEVDAQAIVKQVSLVVHI